jgi:hypothetical protein
MFESPVTRFCNSSSIVLDGSILFSRIHSSAAHGILILLLHKVRDRICSYILRAPPADCIRWKIMSIFSFTAFLNPYTALVAQRKSAPSAVIWGIGEDSQFQSLQMLPFRRTCDSAGLITTSNCRVFLTFLTFIHIIAQRNSSHVSCNAYRNSSAPTSRSNANCCAWRWFLDRRKSKGLIDDCLLLEFALNGNLHVYLTVHLGTTLERRLAWCIQATEAVAYAHSKFA